MLYTSIIRQSETDRNCVVYLVHMVVIKPAHMLPEAAFVNGSDLLQQDHRILRQPHATTGDIDMGRKSGFSRLAGYSRGNHRRRMAVSRIILHDQDRPGTSLLAAHHRRQIGIKYVPTFY